MKSLLICGLSLTVTLLASAQVLVYTGTLSTTAVGGREQWREKVPQVLILDLSPDRDPANFIALLIPVDGGDFIECDNLSQKLSFLELQGSRGASYTLAYNRRVASHPRRAIMAGDVAYEVETAFILGKHRMIKLGKGLPSIYFASSFTGPYAEFEDTGTVEANEVDKGSVTLRLHAKETQVANTPGLGGGTLGFVQTVERQKAILAKKYRVPTERICIND